MGIFDKELNVDMMDVQDRAVVDSEGCHHNLNPEVLVMMKQKLEGIKGLINRNPCVGCELEHTTDAGQLDFCHYKCKD